jgi:hypothetical protein
MSVYEKSYTFRARGGTREEAIDNLLAEEGEEVPILRRMLQKKQQDLYDTKFADTMRDRDWEVLGDLMALLGEPLPPQRPH